MSTTKTSNQTILTKLYEEDALMLDRIAALGLLQGWKGDWDSRADVVGHVVAAYLSGLPKASRDMLRAA